VMTFLAREAIDRRIPRVAALSTDAMPGLAVLSRKVVAKGGGPLMSPSRLQQQDGRLGVGPRSMVHPARNYAQLSGMEDDCAVPQLKGQGSVEDEEQFVRVIVSMPYELVLELRYAHDVVVVGEHCMRIPVP
jgi:hypothetical protein